MIKTGIGIDSHGFTDGDGLVLGGATIPYGKSISGHSDGDVVLHAMVDAILGALAQGDIGSHFPSSDPQWQGASSRLFLRHVKKLADLAQVTLQHLDCTIILQEPPVAPFIPEMRQNVAQDLGVDLSCISIKATTTDYLGFTGRKEGIIAVAVATVDY